MKPVIAEVSEELNLLPLAVCEAQEVCLESAVYSVPTFLVMVRDELVSREGGPRSSDEFKALFNKAV